MNLRNNPIVRQLVFLFRGFMDKISYTIGKNNKKSISGVSVFNKYHVRGSNNLIKSGKGSVIKKCLIHIQGSNNKIYIGENACISGAELWIEDNNCTIRIGDDTFVGHHSHLACTEDNSELVIGNNCMLSSYVQVRTGDSHSILDMNGVRINKASSVLIGNHCWIGEGSKVLKGVELANDVVVSTGAIVTKSFSNNVLLGGIPAKIIKEQITWDSKRIL